VFLSLKEIGRKHPKIRKALTTCVVGGALAASLALVVTAVDATPASTTAQSASAHTGDLKVTATCNVKTGQYDQSATLTLAAVPTGETGTIVWHQGTTSFVNNWNGNSFTFEGNAGTSGNGPVPITGLPSLPGTTTGNGPWLYVYTTFDKGDTFTIKSDNYPGNPTPLTGNCVKEDSKDAAADIAITPATCTAPASAAWTGLQFATGSALDETVGPHSGTATAESGHKFPDGSATLVKDYAIADKDLSKCPQMQACTATTDGGKASALNLNGWYFTNDTRSGGHHEFTQDGVRLYTDSNTSVDKSTMYRAETEVPLAQFGEPSVLFKAGGTGVKPGMQIGLDIDGNGTWDGYLVGEPWSYGAGQWWTNKTNFGVTPGGGYASMGTLQDYLNANPNAKVTEFGFSLGSGVQGDWTILGTTVHCVNYTFGYPANPGARTYDTRDAPVCTNDGTGTITTEHHSVQQAWNPATGKFEDDPTTDVVTGTSTETVDTSVCPITFEQCETQTTLPTATPSNPLGWGDVLNGTWVSNGIDLKATSSEEAYAYVDLDAAHQFKFSDIGSLATDATQIHGASAIIMQATGGQNIHYEANGTYWTIHPGLFPETAPGYYSTTNPAAAGQTLSNPTVTEVAVWVNPGDEVVLHKQSYHCLTQPFDVDRATPPAPTYNQVCTAGKGVNTVNLPNTTLATYVTTWNGDHTVATTVGTPTANNGFVKGDGYTLNENGTATWVFTFPSVVCLNTLAVTGVNITVAGALGAAAVLLGLLAKLVLLPYLRRRRPIQG
jgi:hypothetical protein